jgi:type II secretory pathway component PulK
MALKALMLATLCESFRLQIRARFADQALSPADWVADAKEALAFVRRGKDNLSKNEVSVSFLLSL